MIKFFSNLLDFNQATLSGCIDTIVIEHEDGTMVGSPFHVRFGKLKLLKSAEKEVSISVNGQDTGLKMKLGKSGEAYFLQRVEDVPDIEDKLDMLEDKEEEVKDNLGIDVEDLYKGIEFFEEASINKMDKVYKKEKEEQAEAEEDVEGDERYEDLVESDSDTIEKTKSEKQYMDIINDLESQGEKERKKRRMETTPQRRTRFGWVWGETPLQENDDNKLVVGVRERSKSESGVESLKLPDLTATKSEKDGEEQQPNDNNILVEASPRGKGIFGRFMGLFRGGQEKYVEEDENAPMFRLEKMDPKKGDFGAITPRDSKQFKREVGMSLCKDLLYTCEKEEINQVFEDNEISYEDF